MRILWEEHQWPYSSPPQRRSKKVTKTSNSGAAYSTYNQDHATSERELQHRGLGVWDVLLELKFKVPSLYIKPYCLAVSELYNLSSDSSKCTWFILSPPS